jgi:hypothetical protein
MERCSTFSSNSTSSEGGRGVDVPVLRGVEVPEALGVGAGMGSFGTSEVIVKETSPVAVATGLAEYFARSMSMVLYLRVSH